MIKVFSSVPGNLGSIQGQVIAKTSKMLLDAFLHNCIIRYRSRVSSTIQGK